MASTIMNPPPQRRRSRSKSISSSSAILLQRTASLTAQGGVRLPFPALHAQSPNESNIILRNLSCQTTLPDPKRRLSVVYSRPNSGNGVLEGVGNLNRWSQSTASTKSSAANTRRNSFSAKASGSYSKSSPILKPQSPPPSWNTQLATKGPPNNSPSRRVQSSSPVRPGDPLPQAATLPSLSQAVDEAESPSTFTSGTPLTADLLTPATYNTLGGDYFGDRWLSRSPPNSKTTVHRAIALGPPVSVSTSAPAPVLVSSQRNKLESSDGQSTVTSVSATFSPTKLVTSRGLREGTPQVYNSRSRNRGESSKGTGGTEGENSASSIRSSQESSERRKPPSQKAMLSKALQKANHAVLLDNAQNYEGATDAYKEACILLRQVMVRSPGDDDRKKLDAVRNTYMSRITELQSIDAPNRSPDDKALPDRPRDSQDSLKFRRIIDADEYNDTATIRNAQQTRTATSRPISTNLSPVKIPPRRQSLLPRGNDRGPLLYSKGGPGESEAAEGARKLKNTIRLELPMVQEYMPAPLSPRRPLSPLCLPEEPIPTTAEPPVSSESGSKISFVYHSRQQTAESTSWLDTIDESGGSSASSVHSRRSSVGVRRKRIRAPSGATEAEFDAALDAAVEAAYDDGFEPADYEEEELVHELPYHVDDQDFMSEVRRNVELAKERVREAEREAAVSLANDRGKRRLHGKLLERNGRDSIDGEYDQDEADEEERILEEMTRDYILDDSQYALQLKSALPRQSDSSGFSGRTAASSVSSIPTTAGTSLSALVELPSIPAIPPQLQIKNHPPPSHPPPSAALPPPPSNSSPSANTFEHPMNESLSNIPRSGVTPPLGVRNRRLSGINKKQLKIETSTVLNHIDGPETTSARLLATVPSHDHMQALTELPESRSVELDSPEIPSDVAFKPFLQQNSARQISSPLPAPSSASAASSGSPATPGLSKVTSITSDDSVPPIPTSPARFVNKTHPGVATLRTNWSSSSLRSRSTAVSPPDLSENSTGTPISSDFLPTSHYRRTPSSVLTLPTSTSRGYSGRLTTTGGLYLFDSNIHSPNSPGLPNPLVADSPVPLEPCPDSFLLRPFWLLRCIYQTIVHSRGGYISTRLFVPRDIWRIKNVKLKGVEEKISSCDLLTAALLKLARVDTLDADRVLIEMQTLETVLDQVQVNLSRKLGSDVGVQGSSNLFKVSSPTDETLSMAETVNSKTANVPGKSYLSSWRKLRSKGSVTSGPSPTITTTMSKSGSRETLTMSSLPMTSLVNPRFPKRNLSHVQYIGPNANYMGALARLCDAVQILDQVARQVEDPGLKRTSQTHVGLELSMRHAAEFFAFFVCRFVLNDVGMMLDKFIKRGGEWVLA